MTNSELLLAISDILDKKLNVTNDILDRIELLLENDILSSLQNIEDC